MTIMEATGICLSEGGLVRYVSHGKRLLGLFMIQEFAAALFFYGLYMLLRLPCWNGPYFTLLLFFFTLLHVDDEDDVVDISVLG